MSTFLQLLQFCSEEENLLPFGTELCSYAAWEVLIYCGRRRFPLSFISFRAMRNCGSLTFLQLLQFYYLEENPLLFGTEARS